MKTVICTLFEGRYHFGVGALANSLHASGYRGTLWVGYKGALPPWGGQPSDGSKIHRYDIAGDFTIAFVSLSTATHLTYLKPEFLGRVFDEFDPLCDAVVYMDPDIIVKCPWRLLRIWPKNGVALVHDVHSLMPERHPMRLSWQEYFAEKNAPADVPRDRYYNAGFIGLARAHRVLLAKWQLNIDAIQAEIGSQGIKYGAAGDLFHSTDQDALNIALMMCPVPVNAAHAESMDFTSGGYLLSHAIGSPKPWDGGFIRDALNGFPPSLPAKAFFQHARSPISLFGNGARLLRLSIGVASAIGRFYRRA